MTPVPRVPPIPLMLDLLMPNVYPHTIVQLVACAFCKVGNLAIQGLKCSYLGILWHSVL